MSLYLLFDGRVAVSARKHITIGRAHYADHHLKFINDVFCVNNKNVSYRHIEAFSTDAGLCLRQHGTNKSFFNEEPILQGEEMVVTRPGKLRLRSSDICEIVDGDVILDVFRLKFSNLQRIQVCERLDLNNRDILEVLAQTQLKCLILERKFYETLLHEVVIDSETLNPVIPPANVDLGLLREFTHYRDICEGFYALGVSNVCEYLSQQTPIYVYRLDRSRIFEGLALRRFAGLFGAAAASQDTAARHFGVEGAESRICKIDAPDDVVRLCLLLCDTRQLARYYSTTESVRRCNFSTHTAPQSAPQTKLSDIRPIYAQPDYPALSDVKPAKITFRKLSYAPTIDSVKESYQIYFSMSSESSENIFKCKSIKPIRKTKPQVQELTDSLSEASANDIINNNPHSAPRSSEPPQASEKPFLENIKRQSSQFPASCITDYTVTSLDDKCKELAIASAAAATYATEYLVFTQYTGFYTHPDTSVTETPPPFVFSRPKQLATAYSLNNSTDFRRSTSTDVKIAVQASQMSAPVEPPLKRVFPCVVKQIAVRDGDVVYLVDGSAIVAEFEVVFDAQGHDPKKIDVNHLTLEDFIE